MANTQKKDIPLVDVETFASRYGYSEKTIKKNIHRIEGAWKEGQDYCIPDSARYPYRMGHTSIQTREDKRYVVLRATSEYRYVDEKMLGLSKTSFRTIVDELTSQGLLINNNSNDVHGVNMYDTSSKADEMLKGGKKKAMVEIGKAVAEIGGTFAAQFAIQ